MRQVYSVNPEENPESVWQERCLRFLEENSVRTVFGARPKDSMKDVLFEFMIHYSNGRDFFHFDFINPIISDPIFRARGIRPREFDRDRSA